MKYMKILRFYLLVFAFTCLGGSVSYSAESSDAAEPVDPRVALENRLAAIDAEMKTIVDENIAIRTTMRDRHQSQYQLREKILQLEEFVPLQEEIVAKQLELRELQERLAHKLADHPEFKAAQAEREAANVALQELMKRNRALVDERIEVQTAIQQLDRASTEQGAE